MLGSLMCEASFTFAVDQAVIDPGQQWAGTPPPLPKPVTARCPTWLTVVHVYHIDTEVGFVPCSRSGEHNLPHSRRVRFAPFHTISADIHDLVQPLGPQTL